MQTGPCSDSRRTSLRSGPPSSATRPAGGGFCRQHAKNADIHAMNGASIPSANSQERPLDAALAERRRALPLRGDWTTEDLLCVVVGAHLRSECEDRPIAEWLVETIRRRLVQHLGPSAGSRRVVPMVMSDLWYLNDRLLTQQPSIVVGDPSVNAAAAHHAVRIPQMLVLEDALRIHLDPEYPRVRAVMWGSGCDRTEQAVRIFAERYLDGFLEAALPAMGATELA